jgi:hypothetical protein
VDCRFRATRCGNRPRGKQAAVAGHVPQAEWNPKRESTCAHANATSLSPEHGIRILLPFVGRSATATSPPLQRNQREATFIAAPVFFLGVCLLLCFFFFAFGGFFFPLPPSLPPSASQPHHQRDRLPRGGVAFSPKVSKHARAAERRLAPLRQKKNIKRQRECHNKPQLFLEFVNLPPPFFRTTKPPPKLLFFFEGRDDESRGVGLQKTFWRR